MPLLHQQQVNSALYNTIVGTVSTAEPADEEVEAENSEAGSSQAGPQADEASQYGDDAEGDQTESTALVVCTVSVIGSGCNHMPASIFVAARI